MEDAGTNVSEKRAKQSTLIPNADLKFKLFRMSSYNTVKVVTRLLKFITCACAVDWRDVEAHLNGIRRVELQAYS